MSQLGQQGARGKGVIKYPGASQKVLQYLRAHPDVMIPYREIESSLGFPAYTVANSIVHLISKGANIDKPMRGTVLFRSAKQVEMPSAPAPQIPSWPNHELFEYVGMMESRSIIRGENDQLFVAIPLQAFLDGKM